MGTHPNPTHISNTFRPGTTFNSATQAPDGAHLHGPPPPAYKEGEVLLLCCLEGTEFGIIWIPRAHEIGKLVHPAFFVVYCMN